MGQNGSAMSGWAGPRNELTSARNQNPFPLETAGQLGSGDSEGGMSSFDLWMKF